jgi:hypothetical protein
MSDVVSKERIPRLPHWRWVTYHCLLGRKHEDIDGSVKKFAQYLKDSGKKKVDAFEMIGLLDLLRHEKSPDPYIARAIALLDEKPLRDILERMLLEHCKPEFIQEAIFSRFKDNIRPEVIKWYQALFWDTATLTSYDFGRYYEKVGLHKRPKPPSVGGRWREECVAFREGASTSIDADAAVKHMFTRAFFRSEELAKYGSLTDQMVIKYQKVALGHYRAMNEAKTRAGETKIPEQFDVEIYYPPQTAFDAGSLEGYDPVVDSGHVQIEEKKDE